MTLRDQTHRELVNRPFQFNKCSQYFFGADDKTLSMAAVRINNPDLSSLRLRDKLIVVADCIRPAVP